MTTPVPDATSGAAPSCVDDEEPFSAAVISSQLTYLASAALDGRAATTPGEAAARAFVAERFRCLGLVAAGDDGTYEQRFDLPAMDALDELVAPGRTANVIGYLPGSDAVVGSEIILVGAHLDHLGAGHLGANDDASGVAGVLAIAQAMAKLGAARRTIAFVAFGAEEQGLLGSQYFVDHPPATLPIERIVQMVNLDMIGSYSSRRRVHAFGAFAKLPATALLRELAADHRSTQVSIGGTSVRGDHFGFCQRGVPYVFFWTPDARCYHATCDTVDRLDTPHLVEIAALAGDLVRGLADSEQDLTAARRCQVR